MEHQEADLKELARKIGEISNQAQQDVAELVNAYHAKHGGDVNIYISGSNIDRAFDQFAGITGWCYTRLGNKRTAGIAKKLRAALGYLR
jgi:hypothetical protein